MNPYEEFPWADVDDVAQVKSMIRKIKWTYSRIKELRVAEMLGRQRVHVLDAIQEKIEELRDAYLSELRNEEKRLFNLIHAVQSKIMDVKYGS